MKSYKSSVAEFKTCTGSKCNTASSHTNCLVCNSTEDVNCATNPSSLNGQTCKSYKDQCFTLISLDEVSRGCLNENDEQFQMNCKIDNEKCEICSSTDGTECNNKPVNVVDTCIHCDSNDDELCRTNPEQMNEKICDKFRPSGQKACYLRIVSAPTIRLIPTHFSIDFVIIVVD